ncbi:MAG: hypothetical protein ACKVS9_11455 [Phycisphaerae bacterium]
MYRFAGLCTGIIGFSACVQLAAASDVIFRGNLHSSTGQATLLIDPNGRLVVDNIGSSGSDGVSISLTPSESIDLHIQPQPRGLPAGASERFSARGTVAGVPNVRFSNWGFTKSSTVLAIDATFPGLGLPPRVVEVFLAGTLVNTSTVSVGAQVATVPPDSWPRLVGVRRNLPPHNRPAVLARWPAPIPIQLAGGPLVIGDEIRVAGVSPTNTLDLVFGIDGSGSDVPELFIDNEDTLPICSGDLDGDDDVDLADLAELLSNFGLVDGVAYSNGDLDRDGDVDLADLSGMLARFGTDC